MVAGEVHRRPFAQRPPGLAEQQATSAKQLYVVQAH
jgi:hypothetical protein